MCSENKSFVQKWSKLEKKLCLKPKLNIFLACRCELYEKEKYVNIKATIENSFKCSVSNFLIKTLIKDVEFNAALEEYVDNIVQNISNRQLPAALTTPNWHPLQDVSKFLSGIPEDSVLQSCYTH